MRHVDGWEPSLRDAVHAFPVEAVALATTFERPVPVPGCLPVERVDRFAVAGYCVVVAVPADDAGKPAPLFGDRQMPALAQLGLDLAELGSHPLFAGDAPQREPSAPPGRAQVREAEELKRLGLPEPTGFAVSGGEPSELDQPRLLGVQFQAERREPVAKVGEEPLGVLTVLEPGDVVVGEPHEDHVPARVSPPPLMGPEVYLGASVSRPDDCWVCTLLTCRRRCDSNREPGARTTYGRTHEVRRTGDMAWADLRVRRNVLPDAGVA